MTRLSETFQISKDWDLDEILLDKATEILNRMETTLELNSVKTSLLNNSPITTQYSYTLYVNKLSDVIVKAELLNIDESYLNQSKVLILKCQMDYWLTASYNRVKDILLADDPYEHDINILRKAIDKALLQSSNSDILNKCKILFTRLDNELTMNRCVKAIPVVKLPMADAPEGYWIPIVDVGHVRVTPEFPKPPIDTGDYIWEASESLQTLRDTYSRLQAVFVNAEVFGINKDLIQLSKEKLLKAEKDLKILEAKDVEDKIVGIEAAVKLAKKAKGKKRKGSPSKKKRIEN